jgi:hypothetical protein
MKLPILVSIPHAGTMMPDEVSIFHFVTTWRTS